MNKEILGNLLRDALSPEFLEINDRTESHSGHASSGGGGHYEVSIVSSQFAGLAHWHVTVWSIRPPTRCVRRYTRCRSRPIARRSMPPKTRPKHSVQPSP